MRYNFDVVTDRWNSNAVKYDEAEKKFGRKDLIPLWIADMDLPTAQPIIDAMAKKCTGNIRIYVTARFLFRICKGMAGEKERLEL